MTAYNLNTWLVPVPGPEVDQKPTVVLVNWRVMQLPGGECNLVGIDEATGFGRVSTAVWHIEHASLRAMTISGRVYYLRGPSGQDAIGIQVWQVVMHGIGVDPDACKDLTDDPAAWPRVDEGRAT